MLVLEEDVEYPLEHLFEGQTIRFSLPSSFVHVSDSQRHKPDQKYSQRPVPPVPVSHDTQGYTGQEHAVPSRIARE